MDFGEELTVLPDELGCCAMKNRDDEGGANPGHGEQWRPVGNKDECIAGW